jgi:hypothetical protein
MTNQEILTKAIEKAIAGGWNWEILQGNLAPPVGITLVPKPLRQTDKGIYIRDWDDYSLILYRQDFAKALWGDKPAEQGWPFRYIWEQQLALMVIADNPIKYLGENI